MSLETPFDPKESVIGDAVSTCVLRDHKLVLKQENVRQLDNAIISQLYFVAYL